MTLSVQNYGTSCNCDTIFKGNVSTPLKSATLIGIDVLSEKNSLTLSVYPNPMQDELTINCSECIREINVIDAKGNVVDYYLNLEQETYSINTSELPNGVCFVKIITSSAYEKVEKVIKME